MLSHVVTCSGTIIDCNAPLCCLSHQTAGRLATAVVGATTARTATPGDDRGSSTAMDMTHAQHLSVHTMVSHYSVAYQIDPMRSSQMAMPVYIMYCKALLRCLYIMQLGRLAAVVSATTARTATNLGHAQAVHHRVSHMRSTCVILLCSKCCCHALRSLCQ